MLPIEYSVGSIALMKLGQHVWEMSTQNSFSPAFGLLKTDNLKKSNLPHRKPWALIEIADKFKIKSKGRGFNISNLVKLLSFFSFGRFS